MYDGNYYLQVDAFQIYIFSPNLSWTLDLQTKYSFNIST